MSSALIRSLPRAKRPRPFLKWAGGKSQLLPEIMARFPAKYRTYYEPFIGGGAVFFGLEPKKAVISDINSNLITTYTAIRDNVEGVMVELKRHRKTEEYFYRLRAKDPSKMNPEKAAARTIYLNRTCFNGLYRVNRSGQFNVPYGRYANPTICDTEKLYLVSEILQSVDIRNASVFDVLAKARKGDLVYLDPPYDPVNPTSSFTAYTRGGFGRQEQEDLAALYGKLAARGVHVVLSNSDTPFICDLYKDFNIARVFARRAINSRADKRGKISEVLVTANC